MSSFTQNTIPLSGIYANSPLRFQTHPGIMSLLSQSEKAKKKYTFFEATDVYMKQDIANNK